MSLAGNLIFKIIKKRLKRYEGKEDEYILKRMPGQNFEEGQMRECKYKIPDGFNFQRFQFNGTNIEFLKRVNQNNSYVVYVLHGGGYHMAMADLYNDIMHRFSMNGKFDVCAIDYRVAPKNPYPAAIEDAVSGYKYLLEKGYKASNIIIAGDSAGGNLALAMTFELRKQGIEIPENFILSSPWVDLFTEYTSNQKETDVLFGWGNAIETCAKNYAGSFDLKNPNISPIFGDFTGIKNVYISVGKDEMLAKQGIELATKMKEQGVNVHLDEMNNGMHDIIAMSILPIKEVKIAWRNIYEFMNKLYK